MIEAHEKFYSRARSAAILHTLFDRRSLWEAREKRRGDFRNADWWTFGSNMYLDLVSSEQYPEYATKVRYWNEVTKAHFKRILDDFLMEFSIAIGKRATYLADDFPQLSISYPGYHIFPGAETYGFFFGKKHQDLQWNTLKLLPGFPDLPMQEHFSFTLPLKIPYMGAALLCGPDALEERYEYEENTLYVHSGQFEHAIAPFKRPVLPCDWRITFQGHGFMVDDVAFLYW